MVYVRRCQVDTRAGPWKAPTRRCADSRRRRARGPSPTPVMGALAAAAQGGQGTAGGGGAGTQRLASVRQSLTPPITGADGGHWRLPHGEVRGQRGGGRGAV